MFWLLSNTFVLGLVRIVLIVVAVGWALLFIDAWRLGDPLALRQKQRLAMVGINGVLCFSVAGTLLFASHVVGVQKDFMSAMFTDGAVTGATDGRYNVLLLGGDSGSDRWGLRPDSISVASIDAETGETVLFGLPRNMLNFPFAKGSIMDEQFPDGFDCGSECELNSLSTWAEDHKNLFKGVANPGIEATTLGGRGHHRPEDQLLRDGQHAGLPQAGRPRSAASRSTSGTGSRSAGSATIKGYIEPGKRKLNGFETLWFARSRVPTPTTTRGWRGRSA